MTTIRAMCLAKTGIENSSDTMTNDKITLSQLETFLFSAADILRGKICAKASLELQIRCSIQLGYGRRLLQHWLCALQTPANR